MGVVVADAGDDLPRQGVEAGDPDRLVGGQACYFKVQLIGV